MITPQEAQPTLAAELGLKTLFFKREDLHPFGSHKGRSIPFMIDIYAKEGATRFAISSSGNAALAAALHIKALNKKTHAKKPLALEVFIGMHINEHKALELRKLAEGDEHITITQTERPLQTLFVTTEDGSVQALRQSNDDTALVGYESLAEELSEIPNLKAVFVPTSSGTTAQALADAFKKDVEIHIVQTMTCHPLAENFTQIMQTDEVSLADAIVDKTALRKPALVPKIKETGGSGYVVSNEEIESALKLAHDHSHIKLSPNSALSLAGLMQAVYTGKKWKGAVVCLVTGR